MKLTTPARVAVGTILLLLAGAIGWWLSERESHNHESAGTTNTTAERKVLYWYDPMRPDQHFSAPGKSPFMDMELVPKYADDSATDETGVRVRAQMVQNLGMRTAPVVRGSLAARIDASGRIEADERSLRKVAVRTTGWIEVLNVRSEGEPVRRGQVLAEVYSPTFDAAQREFVLALDAGDAALAAAARDKLAALGFTDEDVAALERSRHPNRRLSIRSPMHGYVMTLAAREGAAVTPDTPLFALVGHDPLWVIVNLPESQSALVAAGSTAEIRAAAYPGKIFAGTVDYLYPELDITTRTRRTRIVLANPDDALHPGMFVDVSLAPHSTGEVLLVPSEAVIRTGRRNVVIVAAGEGMYRPVSVVVGVERDGTTVVVEGLDEGDLVVTSGQFLIDSEASLRGASNRMHDHAGEMP